MEGTTNRKRTTQSGAGSLKAIPWFAFFLALFLPLQASGYMRYQTDAARGALGYFEAVKINSEALPYEIDRDVIRIPCVQDGDQVITTINSLTLELGERGDALMTVDLEFVCSHDWTEVIPVTEDVPGRYETLDEALKITFDPHDLFVADALLQGGVLQFDLRDAAVTQFVLHLVMKRVDPEL